MENARAGGEGKCFKREPRISAELFPAAELFIPRDG
jgi:hypothetical protein